MKSALLILDEKANTEEMIRLYLNLNNSMIEKHGVNGITVLVNDEAITGREQELEKKANIIFFPNWKNDIRYRNLIRQTLESTKDIYLMKQINDNWQLKKAQKDDYEILDYNEEINIKPK